MNKKKNICILILLLLVIGGIIFLLGRDKNKTNKDNLSLGLIVDLDADYDSDMDGISNKDEKKYGTDALVVDTDMDGLVDGYEINNSKTDPLKVDSDNDGLNDLNEVILGYDPNDEKSNNKDKKDNYSFKYENVKVSLSGTGNIVDTYVNIDNYSNFINEDTMIGKEYSFYSEGDIDSISVTIGYTANELEKIDMDVDYPEIGIFRVNKEDYNDYYYVKSTIDKKNNTISAVLPDINKYFYVIGDGKSFEYDGSGGGGGASFDEWHLVADSGFDVKKNGFSFDNYISNFANKGHCYGMALFADLYYTKKLPLQSDAKNYQKPILKDTIFEFNIDHFEPSYSYDLTGTYFENYDNLYDFKIKTKLAIKKGKKIEAIEINENSLQEDKSISNDELQMFNAIYQAHTMQLNIDAYYTGNIVGDSYDCTIKGVIQCDFDAGRNIDILKNRMLNKEAPVIFYYGLSSHAVNAIRLYRNNNNPKEYRLYVYDNNEHGNDSLYYDLECNLFSCKTKKHDMAIAIVKSLDEELKYFKNS